MAKKKANGVKSGSVNKSDPPLYPPPDSIKLETPLRLVSLDLKTKTLVVEAATPQQVSTLQRSNVTIPAYCAEDMLRCRGLSDADRRRLETIADGERKRLDLNARLKGYAETCLARMLPFMSAAERRSATKGKLPNALPDTAPAEAHDALRAWHTLNQIVAELVKADDWPDELDRALCLAIDFGQLLQRGQVQIDYGQIVDSGRRNAESRDAANQAKRRDAEAKEQAAHAEFSRRMASATSDRMKTATLSNMAKERTSDGKLRFYSLVHLKRLAKNW